MATIGAQAAEAVGHALDVLAAHGLLVDGPQASPAVAGEAAIAAAYGVAPATAADRIRAARVGVAGESAAAEQIARLLHADGVGEVRRLTWDEHDVDLAVVAPAPAEISRLPGWNRLALEHGLRWVALRPFDGLVFAIGPLMIPGESCCHECLQLRLAAHVEYGADLTLVENEPTAASATAGLQAVAAGIVGHLALCWLAGIDTRLPGVLHILETQPELSLGTHAVLRVPRCPACSDADLLAAHLPWHEAEAA